MTEPGEGERRSREADNLRAVYQSLQPSKAQEQGKGSYGGKAAAGAAGAALLFVLGKAKFFSLLAGLVKFKTLATMLLSIGAYAVEWGWLFSASPLAGDAQDSHASRRRVQLPAAPRCSRLHLLLPAEAAASPSRISTCAVM